ncbi:MAG: hypothetical protein ABEJ92_08640 [Halobacteriales archaeon]
MTEAQARVVAVVRHREHVLVCGEPGPDGDGPALPARDTAAEPAERALGHLLDDLGVAVEAVQRRGGPVPAGGVRLVPFFVDVGDRSATGGPQCPEPTWAGPAALLGAGNDRWWRTYAAVAPTAETVADDMERGSTAIAVDALWALRDAAARAAFEGAGLGPVVDTARSLLDARPSMAALANRVNRAMAGADTPAAVEAAATDGLRRAHAADVGAAALAAETVDGDRVLTLSRSGTVRAALLDARPSVVVLASRPGGEGLAVADELADAGLDAASVPDAAVYDRLRGGDADVVLVGADAVTPDGGVVNKVGTRAAAHAAALAGVPCYVVCASDKVRPAPEPDGDDGERGEFLEPLFDLTPADLVTAVLTERGQLSADEVREVAEEHRRLAAWDA